MRRLAAVWLLGYASPATHRPYATDIIAWLAFCDQAGAGPLEARRVHVAAWARVLQAGAAPRTTARRIAAVSSWYQYLAGEGLRAGSPAEYASPPEDPRTRARSRPDRGELGRLRAAIRAHGSKRSIALIELLEVT